MNAAVQLERVIMNGLKNGESLAEYMLKAEGVVVLKPDTFDEAANLVLMHSEDLSKYSFTMNEKGEIETYSKTENKGFLSRWLERCGL